MTTKPPPEGQSEDSESGVVVPQAASSAEGTSPQKNAVETDDISKEASHEGEVKRPYSVGRGRPPQNSRYKPGQSGNPKGRKKKSRNLRTIVKQVLEEDIKIQVGGRVKRMPAIEALVRTTLAHALKHEPKAVASLTILMRQGSYGVDHEDGGADLLATPEINAIVEDFVARLGLKDTGVPASNEDGPPLPAATSPLPAKE